MVVAHPDTLCYTCSRWAILRRIALEMPAALNMQEGIAPDIHKRTVWGCLLGKGQAGAHIAGESRFSRANEC